MNEEVELFSLRTDSPVCVTECRPHLHARIYPPVAGTDVFSGSRTDISLEQLSHLGRDEWTRVSRRLQQENGRLVQHLCARSTVLFFGNHVRLVTTDSTLRVFCTVRYGTATEALTQLRSAPAHRHRTRAHDRDNPPEFSAIHARRPAFAFSSPLDARVVLAMSRSLCSVLPYLKSLKL